MPKKTSDSLDLIQEIITEASVEILSPFMEHKPVKHALVKVLLEKGLTYNAIQQACHISPNEIAKIKMSSDEVLNESLVDTIRNMEINKLYVIQGKILNALDDPDKLKGMKGGELAYAYKLLLDSRRLLENKTTANIGVIVQSLARQFNDEAEKINNVLSRIAKKPKGAIECSTSMSQ